MTASVNEQVGSADAARIQLDRAGFVEAFGSRFRNGAALAGRAFDAAPTMAIDGATVFQALREQFRSATEAEKLAILKVYTPLDPIVQATRLVADEERSDGLRAMTASQQRRLLELLKAYTTKFGFDVIFVVRDHTTSSLLATLESRLADDMATELRTTYGHVERLAEIQVEAYFAAGR